MSNLILTIIDSFHNFTLFTLLSFIVTINIGLIIYMWYLSRRYYAESKKPTAINVIIKKDKDNEQQTS